MVAGERDPGYDKFCLDVVEPTLRILGPEVGRCDLVLGGLDERLLLQGVGEGLHGDCSGGGDVYRGGVVRHGAYVSAASPGLLLAVCGLLARGGGGGAA